MNLTEKIVGLLVIITAIGSIILIIGKLQDSSSLKTTGETAAFIGVCGLVITLIIYIKLKEWEYEEKGFDTLGKLLSK